MEKRKTIQAYDLLRIIAIGAVILTHASSWFIRHYRFPAEEYTLSGLINGPVRFAVPVFVMITGALMLPESRPDMEPLPFYKKYLIRFIRALIFWLGLYSIYYHILLPAVQGNDVSWHDAADMFLHVRDQAVAFWYMYLVIGIYLMLPFLKLISKRANKKYIQVFILIAIIVQFIPTFTSFMTKGTLLETTTFSTENCLTLFTGFTSYLLLGWYLSTFEISRRNRYILYCTGIAMLILHPLLQLWIRPITPDIRLSLVSALSIFELVPATAIFMFFVQKYGKRYSSPRLQWLGGATFGVYLIHYVILDALQTHIMPYSGNFLIIYIFASAAACFCISLAVVFILQKLPLMKKLL